MVNDSSREQAEKEAEQGMVVGGKLKFSLKISHKVPKGDELLEQFKESCYIIWCFKIKSASSYFDIAQAEIMGLIQKCMGKFFWPML